MSSSTIHALDHLNAHPGETYTEIIQRFIGLGSEEGELTQEEWAWIEQAETKYKSGRTYSLDELKQRLGDE